jgi:hypothetical protein
MLRKKEKNKTKELTDPRRLIAQQMDDRLPIQMGQKPNWMGFDQLFEECDAGTPGR